MNLKRVIIIILLITTISLSFAFTARAEYQVLHNFTGDTNDGAEPMLSSLIQSGSTLYGMTSRGGNNNLGIIFKMDTDGTGFQILHSFISAGADGSVPYGSLLLSGSVLYGMATSEHTSYGGTVFKLNTDGSGFQVLKSFSQTDGIWPYNSLIQSDSALYGMCTFGGNGSGQEGNGTVFRINTNGSGFQLLRTFTGGYADGGMPHGSLIQSGSALYGMNTFGGSANSSGFNGNGTIFKINADGTNFQLLHTLTANDGANPYGSPLLYDSNLYAAAGNGGAFGNGTIFRININGTGYQLLHTFDGTNGASPRGSLVCSGTTLYGTTRNGGGSGAGTIFKINTDGAGFQVLHNFSGVYGMYPRCTLLLSGLTLYGMTSEGGSSNKGVIFALDVPVACVNPPVSDLNGDCRVDFQDFAFLTNQWLDCGLYPPEACGQQ